MPDPRDRVRTPRDEPLPPRVEAEYQALMTALLVERYGPISGAQRACDDAADPRRHP